VSERGLTLLDQALPLERPTVEFALCSDGATYLRTFHLASVERASTDRIAGTCSNIEGIFFRDRRK
jgi:hypothetical protein